MESASGNHLIILQSHPSNISCLTTDFLKKGLKEMTLLEKHYLFCIRSNKLVSLMHKLKCYLMVKYKKCTHSLEGVAAVKSSVKKHL